MLSAVQANEAYSSLVNEFRVKAEALIKECPPDSLPRTQLATVLSVMQGPGRNFTDAEIAQAIKSRDTPGPRYTTAQVLERLRQLEERERNAALHGHLDK